MDTSVDYSVLLVEDSPDDARFVFSALENSQAGRFHPKHVPDLRSALSAVSIRDFDVILLDLGLPDASGIEAVRQMCRRYPDVPVVVLTANDSDDIAVQAIENGAQDFLAKHLPFPNADRLVRTLHYAIARSGVLPEVRAEISDLARPPEKPERGIEAELDEVKGRLQMLTMQSENALPHPRERELIGIELRRFIEILQHHFNREELRCLAMKERLPEAACERITRLLEEHASLHQKFGRIIQRSDAMALDQLKRETLAALCCFIEHEISESALMRLVEGN